MAEDKKEVSAEKVVAPQGDVELKGADAEAHDAAVEASDDRIAALEKIGDVLRENFDGGVSNAPVTAGAEAFVAAAQKQVEDGVKTNDDGYVIGVDGVNPVSNENPDPRCVEGVRL